MGGKFTLECYGWEIEAMASTLTKKQVRELNQLMKENDYEEVADAREDFEDIGIDVLEPNLFHFSKPLNNGELYFRLLNEKGDEILKFDLANMGDLRKTIQDFDERYENKNYSTEPQKGKHENILLCIDKREGGLFYMEFETDDTPIAKDFVYSVASINTPDGDWHFVSNIFYKEEELEISDFLTNSMKASTVALWTLNKA